jgi:hypothetical protein
VWGRVCVCVCVCVSECGGGWGGCASKLICVIGVPRATLFIFSCAKTGVGMVVVVERLLKMLPNFGIPPELVCKSRSHNFTARLLVV